MSELPKRSSRYRWLLFCVFAVVAGFALQRRMKVEAAEAVGGVVAFDGTDDAVDSTAVTPEWLREVAGDEYYQRTTTVDFSTDWRSRSKSNYSKIQNEDLVLLAKFADLKTLDLGNNPAITDAGLMYLAGLQLETLNLHRTGIEGSGLRYLRSYQALKGVSLKHTPLGDEGMKHFRHLGKLNWLNLSNTKITDDGLQHLTSLVALETLALGNTAVTDRGLDHLRTITGLKRLDLHGTSVTAAGVRALQAALSDCQISPTAERLSAVPEDIPLWEPSYSPTRTELVDKIEDLGGRIRVDDNQVGQPIVDFMLFDSNISDTSLLRLLAEMPNLEELNLRNVLVGDGVVEQLSNWPKLRFVSLQGSRITDAGLPHFSKLQKLKDLDLSSTRVGDAGLQSLSQLKQLEALDIGETFVTVDGAFRIRQAIPACRVND